MRTLKSLTNNIYRILSHGSSLETAVDTISRYHGDDYLKFSMVNRVAYNKSLIDSNNLFDMFVLTWAPYQRAQLHNHPGGECLMRVMDGTLIENTFYNTEKTVSTNILYGDMIRYISNDRIYHSISNLCSISISIHIYTHSKNDKTNN